MLYSNINGSNNDSGLLYKNFNGLAQYKVAPMFPKWSAPQAKYINLKNENGMLDTMNDKGKGLNINPNGKDRPKNIPNSEIQDGGFKNVKPLMSQTNQLSRVDIIPNNNLGRLATGDIVGLTTTPSQPARGDVKEMKMFDNFLSKTDVDKFSKVKYTAPRKRFIKQSEKLKNI